MKIVHTTHREVTKSVESETAILIDTATIADADFRAKVEAYLSLEKAQEFLREQAPSIRKHFGPLVFLTVARGTQPTVKECAGDGLEFSSNAIEAHEYVNDLLWATATAIAEKTGVRPGIFAERAGIQLQTLRESDLPNPQDKFKQFCEGTLPDHPVDENDSLAVFNAQHSKKQESAQARRARQDAERAAPAPMNQTMLANLEVRRASGEYV